MSRILYERRCKCNEEFSITKKRTRKLQKLLRYPNPSEVKIRSKTFQIKYEKRLSSTSKFIFNSFQNKYIYYAMDDILYSLKLNPLERDNILSILYSPILSLQNNFSINFFDIWIGEIYIDEISKVNKFLNSKSQTCPQISYITLKLFYKTGVPKKKQEPLW